MIIRSHSVRTLDTGLSPMQERLLRCEKHVRLVAAPTGSGKSHAFMRAALDEGAAVLFIVPTRRLLQNLIEDAREQARQRLRDRGLDEEEANARIDEQIIEWSGNQPKDGSRSLASTRAGQLLSAGPPGGRVLFAIPEVVVKMISGAPVTGGRTVNPFYYLRHFDHIVFDEFHTIDDRSFGLACLLSLLAVRVRKGKVSLLSATPIDVTKVLERTGVGPDDVEKISEEIVDGHPPGNRPIHGNVAVTLRECALHESFALSIDAVRSAIARGRTVVVIYDSLKRLILEEPSIRKTLGDAGLAKAKVLTINTIDDSERKPGEPRRGRRYKDPREYDVLVSTSSIEVGVTFSSTLMFTEPGFGLGSFMQRVGRVSRGREDGQVIVSLAQQRRNRHAWTRRIAAVVEQHEELTAQDFTAEILRDVRRRLEPTRSETATAQASDDTTVRFYRRASWRGAYWAALFIVAIRRTRMPIQRAARDRLYQESSPLVKCIDSRIEEILSVEMVNDNLPRRSQPHKRWVNALLKAALAYRDIGATVEVVDPDGTRHTVTESFLRRETDILRRYVACEEDDARVVHLMSGTLDEEIRASSGDRKPERLKLHVLSPIGDRGFSLSVHEREKRTEQLHARLVEEWQHRFGPSIPGSGEVARDPRRKVMRAATALVEKLGRPPLDEDHDEESALFA